MTLTEFGLRRGVVVERVQAQQQDLGLVELI
jgi:hypothetical protein